MHDFVSDSEDDVPGYASEISDDEEIAAMDGSTDFILNFPDFSDIIDINFELNGQPTNDSEPDHIAAGTASDVDELTEGSSDIGITDEESSASQLSPAKLRSIGLCQPLNIQMGDGAASVKFHPNTNLLTTATDTHLISYRLHGYAIERISTVMHHSNPALDSSNRCCLTYNSSGSRLFCGSRDSTVLVYDTETMDVLRRLPKAHRTGVECIATMSENSFLTADGAGYVHGWDTRKREPSFEIRCGKTKINDIVAEDDGASTFVVATDDHCIKAANYDVKMRCLMRMSFPDAMSCVCLFRNGTRIAGGCSDGRVYVLHRGTELSSPDCCCGDSVYSAVTCMQAVGDNRLMTGGHGGGKGYIRALELYPKSEYYGEVSYDLETGESSVEALTVSYDQQYLASCSFGDTVKLWDLPGIYETPVTLKNTVEEDFYEGIRLTSSKENLAQSVVTATADGNGGDDRGGSARKLRKLR